MRFCKFGLLHAKNFVFWTFCKMCVSLIFFEMCFYFRATFAFSYIFRNVANVFPFL